MTSAAFLRLVEDANMRFVARNYADEHPVALHKRGGKKTAGEFTGKTARILDDRYILWLRAIDPETGRIVLTHRRPEKLEDADEFVMPIREAIKRLRGPDQPYAPEYRWLRSVLAWRGLPCLCNCADVVAHIAMLERTHPAEVTRTVLEAARRVVEEIRRAGSLTQIAAPVTRRLEPIRRRAPVALPELARTYWPCGCTERFACANTKDEPCVRGDLRAVS